MYDIYTITNNEIAKHGGDNVDRIYPIKLEIKQTTDKTKSKPYLDLCLEIDSYYRIRTKPYDKGDDFNIPIMNFPFKFSNTCI